jgi:hypothetical protein
MSSNSWTSTAVASEARPFSEQAWRAVEAQHRAATMSLVDSLAEQAQLEALLDATKPPIPAAALGLHWLLFTPFRYPTSKHGSRFRRPYDPGVFYAAGERGMACAELGYWRWRFLTESPALESIDTLPQTLFKVAERSRAIDVRDTPFSQEEAHFLDKADQPIAKRLLLSCVTCKSTQLSTSPCATRPPAAALQCSRLRRLQKKSRSAQRPGICQSRSIALSGKRMTSCHP